VTVSHRNEDQWTRERTLHVLAADEVRSILQKAIRRGWLEEDHVGPLTELIDSRVAGA